MRQFKPLWIAAIALFTFALWTVPGEALAQNILQDIAVASTIEDIKKRGTMRVGVSAFVPWVMRDKAGKLVGFEVDVSERLAKDMKIKLELVPTAFDGIIAGLMGGQVRRHHHRYFSPHPEGAQHQLHDSLCALRPGACGE